MQPPVEIRSIPRDDGERLLHIWEGAVRATHHFLTPADIDFFRPLIVDGLFGLDHLLGAYQGGMLVGFVGVQGDKMEALFIDPALHRQGLGTTLAHHAMQQLAVTLVDVNEQNPDALGFYQALGFTVVDRSPLDGTGKPFPILHLKLS